MLSATVVIGFLKFNAASYNSGYDIFFFQPNTSYIFSIFLHEHIYCGYSFEEPWRGHNIFIEKINICIWIFLSRAYPIYSQLFLVKHSFEMLKAFQCVS